MNRRRFCGALGAGALVWSMPALAAERALSRPLPIGGRILLVSDDSVPVIRMVLGVPFGMLSKGWKDQPYGWAWRLQWSVTDPEVVAEIETLGAMVSFSVGESASWLHIVCLSENAERVFELVGGLVKWGFEDFHADPEYFQRFMMIDWKHRALVPAIRLGWAIDRVCYREGDPRLQASTPPAVPRLEGRRLLTLRNMMVRHPRRVIGFSGDLDGRQAVSLARLLLPEEETGGGGGIPPLVVPPLRETREDGVTYLKGLEQAWIGLAAATRTWEDPDASGVWVLDAVLRMRLMRRIREELGAAYVIETTSPVRGFEDIYRVLVPTRFANLDSTLAAMGEEFDRLASGDVTESEREAALAATYGSFSLQWQSPTSVLMNLIRYELHRSFSDNVGSLTEQIEELDLAALNACAPFFARERFTEVLLLPKTER